MHRRSPAALTVYIAANSIFDIEPGLMKYLRPEFCTKIKGARRGKFVSRDHRQKKFNKNWRETVLAGAWPYGCVRSLRILGMALFSDLISRQLSLSGSRTGQ